jgi:hypothetical protein
MSNNKNQPLVPSPKGGKVKGQSHGAFTLSHRVKSGHVPKSTREGKSYHIIVEHLTGYAVDRLGREPGPLVRMAIEQVAADYLCQRLIFAWAMRQDAIGKDGRSRGNQEPFGRIPEKYFRFRNLFTKSLNQLAQLLDSSAASLRRSMDEELDVIEVLPDEGKANG